jgi:hypothetical protein
MKISLADRDGATETEHRDREENATDESDDCEAAPVFFILPKVVRGLSLSADHLGLCKID